MRNHSKILILFSSLLLASCGNNVLKGESYHFDPYSYSNEEPIAPETYDFSHEDEMELDGKYKDKYGKSVYRLYHKNDETSPFYADLYTYFGKNGIHVYVYVNDSIINYVPQRQIYYNSSVEIFINDISKTYIDNHSVQWRIAAGGKALKYCGVRYRSTWTSSYFDGSFATHVDGEINTKGAKGYGVEAFTPYYELGLDKGSVLNGANIYLAMNRVPTTSLDQKLTFRQRTAKTLSFQATPTTWVPVFKTEDNSGSNGFPVSSFYGRKNGIDISEGFRFEGEEDKEVGYLEKTVAVNYAMVKKDYDPTHYYYECRIKNITGSSGKIGLFTYLSGNRFTLYLQKANASRAGLVQRDSTNASWNWNVNEGECYINDFDGEDVNFLKGDGAKLALYRNKDCYAFFVNDVLYYATSDLVLDKGTFSPKKKVVLNHALSAFEGLYEESFVGIYSYSARAAFSHYGIYSGEAADAAVSAFMK